MKNLFFCAVLLLGLGAGCSSPVSSSMPDEFWAYGTWRYDGDNKVLSMAANGTAFITMHFTREQDEQYLIDGTVTYDADSLSCEVFALSTDVLCTSTCQLSETVPGELSGVAVVRDGKLLITQHWVTKPDERYTSFCTSENHEVSATGSSWAVWQTMGPLGAGIVDGTWEIDISDAAFIDDLPLDEVTDAKTISANFEVEANATAASGLIGFYRELP